MRAATRIGLLLAALLLGVTYARPLWHIGLIAPQYPEGLGMYIWSIQITGQKPHDLQSINGLNHYIGMKAIIPESIPELRFMPMLIGGLIGLALVAALEAVGYLTSAKEITPESDTTLSSEVSGQALPSVRKMEIGKGKYWVYTERGNVVSLPLKITHKYEQPGCHVCLDYVANLGDVSTGSVGSPDGWSTVFVRTKSGNDIWSKAVAAGMFETKPIEGVKPGLELVTKLAKEKIDKNKATVEGRKTFGVNKALRDPYA